jgi:hypothetical protein
MGGVMVATAAQVNAAEGAARRWLAAGGHKTRRSLESDAL